MPIKNGFQAAQAIKTLFDNFNSDLRGASDSPHECQVVRPLICYLSQLEKADYETMNASNSSIKADCYIEKPLPVKDLVSLIKLLNLA